MKTYDEIKFEVCVSLIEKEQDIFAEFLHEPEEDNFDYPNIYQAIICNQKANEPDNDLVSVTKGTRKPGNRAERRKATVKAKRRMKEKEPFTMSIRITRNGGVIKRGDTYTWLPEWKRLDRIIRRHDGKEVCRSYSEDVYLRDEIEREDIADDDFDPDFNPWGYTYEEKYELNPDNLHGDFSDEDLKKIIDDYHRYDDDWDDDWDYDYDDYWEEEAPCEGCKAITEEIPELRREINTYKDFLGEFNLTTLYERWLADNQRGEENGKDR